MGDNPIEKKHGKPQREKGVFEHLSDSINHSLMGNLNNFVKIGWIPSLILISILIFVFLLLSR
jgi:hypothetical protein